MNLAEGNIYLFVADDIDLENFGKKKKKKKTTFNLDELVENLPDKEVQFVHLS